MEIHSGDVVTLESSDQTHPRSTITSIIPVIPRTKEARAKQRLARKATQMHPTVKAYKMKRNLVVKYLCIDKLMMFFFFFSSVSTT